MTEGLEHSLNVPQQIDQKGAALCNHPLHHSSLKPRNHRTPDLLHSQSFTVWATACKYFSPNCLLCPLRTTSWPGPPVVTAERWADLHTHTTRTPTATAASSSTPKGMNRIRTARVQAAHRLSEGEWKATNGADESVSYQTLYPRVTSAPTFKIRRLDTASKVFLWGIIIMK